MSKAVLGFIANCMDELGISYQFGQWNINPVPDPYFVGEYSEPDTPEKEESGRQEISFLLTGTGTTWLNLENAKEIIENNISRTAILPNGNGIAVSYAGALVVPTGDGELKRIQINLTLQEWSVNL